MQYSKPPLSIEVQANQLQQRGLQCDAPDRLRHYLTHIGYYRLSAYWLPFEHPVAADTSGRSHNFQPGTTFDQVLDLYIFDRKLRLLVMEALERIETSVRSHWGNALAVRHGSHAHMQPELFNSPWQHAADIARLASDLKESKEAFVVHYRERYSTPYLPPIWAVAETLSLGTLSRWFKSTRDTSAKHEVAQSLGMPTIDILEKVLHALTPVRNICAHHGRLWNRRFALQLPIIRRIEDQMVIESITTTSKQKTDCQQCQEIVHRERTTTQQQPSRQLYNYLVVMAHLMAHINPGSSWRDRVRQLIADRNATQQRAMGFPEAWQERAPWGPSQ